MWSLACGACGEAGPWQGAARVLVGYGSSAHALRRQEGGRTGYGSLRMPGRASSRRVKLVWEGGEPRPRGKVARARRAAPRARGAGPGERAALLRPASYCLRSGGLGGAVGLLRTSGVGTRVSVRLRLMSSR